MTRLTSRDVKLVRDIALSHVLSRDQIIALGYFGSVTRANTRLRELAAINVVQRLETPFFGQSLYTTARLAPEVIGEAISSRIDRHGTSPRFIRHALQTTAVRIALTRKGREWRFEQQLWRTFELGRTYEIRPDGMLLAPIPVLVETDLGHVAPTKFKEKLISYQALARSGQSIRLYSSPTFRLLIATTGPIRARRLRSLLPDPGFDLLCQTFEEMGAPSIPHWS